MQIQKYIILNGIFLLRLFKSQIVLEGGQIGKVYCVGISNDEKFIASGAWDSSVVIYDLKTQNLLKRIILPYPWVYALEFSPDGNILAVICKFYIIIYKLPDFMEVTRFQGSCGDDDKQTLAFSPNGDYLAVGCKQKILVFDVDNKFNEIKNINFSQESVLSVKYSPDGTTLSCGGEDKYINLYDAKNNYQLIMSLNVHEKWILSLSYSHDGKYLAFSSSDNTVKILDVRKNYKEIMQINADNMSFDTIDFSPKSSSILSIGSIALNKIKIFQIYDLKFTELLSLDDQKQINQLRFLPNGSELAAATFDGETKIYELCKNYGLQNSELCLRCPFNQVIMNNKCESCSIFYNKNSYNECQFNTLLAFVSCMFAIAIIIFTFIYIFKQNSDDPPLLSAKIKQTYELQ